MGLFHSTFPAPGWPLYSWAKDLRAIFSVGNKDGRDLTVPKISSAGKLETVEIKEGFVE